MPQDSYLCRNYLSDFTRFSTRFIADPIALGMGVGILVASHIFIKKHGTVRLRIPLTNVDSHLKLAEKLGIQSNFTSPPCSLYFLILMVFLSLGSYTPRLVAAGIPILGPMMFFTFVLVVGLIYELKSGALKWENSSSIGLPFKAFGFSRFIRVITRIDRYISNSRIIDLSSRD